MFSFVQDAAVTAITTCTESRRLCLHSRGNSTVGGSAFFTCVINSTELNTIEWTGGDRDISYLQITPLFETVEILEFSNLTLDHDMTMVACRAIYSNGESLTTFFLELRVQGMD